MRQAPCNFAVILQNTSFPLRLAARKKCSFSQTAFLEQFHFEIALAIV
ncbi:hypothetical protein [Desulfovibrio sp. 6_1_46AFAA]|nr:hypothetical protein [Desulfovibrio sp. 6_1_46AFAA]